MTAADDLIEKATPLALAGNSLALEYVARVAAADDPEAEYAAIAVEFQALGIALMEQVRLALAALPPTTETPS